MIWPRFEARTSLHKVMKKSSCIKSTKLIISRLSIYTKFKLHQILEWSYHDQPSTSANEICTPSYHTSTKAAKILCNNHSTTRIPNCNWPSFLQWCTDTLLVLVRARSRKVSHAAHAPNLHDTYFCKMAAPCYCSRRCCSLGSLRIRIREIRAPIRLFCTIYPYTRILASKTAH